MNELHKRLFYKEKTESQPFVNAPMLNDCKALDQEVAGLFALKRDKADIKIDKEEYRVI